MKKCRSINNSLRARSICKTYQPAFFHLGDCATYQPAIDQSDWPIQTVMVQVLSSDYAQISCAVTSDCP